MTPHEMPKTSGLIRKTLSLFLLMFLIQIVFLGTIVGIVVQTRAEITKQQEARLALSRLGRIGRSLQDVVRTAAIRALNKRQISLDQYNNLVVKLHKDVNNLKSVLAGNAMYEPAMEEIERNTKAIPEIYAQLQNKGFAPVQQGQSIYEGWQDQGWFRIHMMETDVTKRLEEIQNDLRKVEQDAQEHLRFQSSLLFNASLLLGLAATVLAAFLLYHIFISGIVVRLARIVSDLSDMTAGKPLRDLRSNIDPDDEIGQLAAHLREMESNLRNIRSKEKTLLANSASCICSIDEEGYIVNISPASSVLWGRAPDELIGESLTSIIEADDVDATREKIEDLFTEQIPVTFENKVRHSDGNVVELSWKASLAAEHNLAVCIAQDVTASNQSLRNIRQSEEELRGMVNSMPMSVITCDETSTISSVNPATQTMLAYAPQDLLGRKLSLVLTGSTDPLPIRQLEEIMTAAEKHAIEMQISKSDGSRLPVEFSTRRYTLQDAKVCLATFKDVSARFQIESVKKEFIGMISHDLRSPLTAIHGTLEVITMDKETITTAADVQDSQIVEHAQSIVYSLVNVLNDFLDLEKFEAGLGSLEVQAVPLKNLLEDIEEEMKSRDYAGELMFNMAGKDCHETVLSIDSARMVFALSTLFSIAAMVSNEATNSHVDIIRSENHIEFSIGNCQPSNEVRNALFSPYVFMSDAKLRGVVPSGLSLSLSRAIVIAHRGSLRVEQDGHDYRISVMLRV